MKAKQLYQSPECEFLFCPDAVALCQSGGDTSITLDPIEDAPTTIVWE